VSFVERTVPFFLLSIAFIFLKPFRTKESIDKFIRLYIISNAVLGFLVLLYVIPGMFIYSHNIESLVTSESMGKFFRDVVETIPIIGEHPIYLSLMTGSSLLFLFYIRFRQRWVNATMSFLFVVILFLSSSRGPTIALLIAICVVILLNKMSAKTKIAVFGAFFLFTTFGLFYSPLKSRLMEFVNTKHIYPQGDYFNSFNTRMGIYKCSFEIGRNAPWYGLGPGDVQSNLDLCYNQYETNAYNTGIFNTHNQYLFYWLSFGTVGLFLFIGSYTIFIRHAYLVKENIYIVFLTYMLVCFLTENILSRNTGIMLFAIFNIMFYCKSHINDSN